MTLDELRSTWEELGRTDPLWAVLTDPERRGGGWDVDEFLATGDAVIRTVLRQVTDAGLTLGEQVLDFGCGAGRLSNALAAHAKEVTGVDIAQSMIDEANRINRHPDRVRFHHFDGHRLPFDDAGFDGVVSLISLQHAHPAVQVVCLMELARVVRPGGTLVLQLPSHPTTPDVLEPAAMRARIDLLDPPARLGAGQFASVRARVTNTGGTRWGAGKLIRLGNHWHTAGEVARWNDGRADLPYDLPPGESVVLDLPVTAPDAEGEHVLELDLVQEAVSWFADAGSDTTRITVTVGAEPVDLPEPGDQEIQPKPAARGRADGGMEMYGMDGYLVRQLLSHVGCQVVAAVPDEMSGPEWVSFTYLIRRGQTS
jgi:SAM-dependent methyltransferase